MAWNASGSIKGPIGAPGATGATGPAGPAGTAAVVPLWDQITAGNITLPRGHLDDSQSYTGTPAVGVDHYTYLLAQVSMTVGHIRYGTAGTTQATATTQLALYSVNASNGALTQIGTTTAKATTGTYGFQTFTITTPVAITAGGMYAVGFLQVGMTPGSVLGAWFNMAYAGGTPALALTGGTGKSSLPASITPTNPTNFPFYYELIA